MIFIETERTYLRNLSLHDAGDFYRLNLDPEVLKFTGDEAFTTVYEAQKFLENYNQYQKYGVGRLAVIEKQSTRFIGWCGLKYNPDKDEYDIGFRFFKAYWNRGYATETALKCLEFGFSTIHAEEIAGRAMKVNTASIRVLEKIGMRFKSTCNFEGAEWVIYCITRQEYMKY